MLLAASVPLAELLTWKATLMSRVAPFVPGFSYFGCRTYAVLVRG